MWTICTGAHSSARSALASSFRASSFCGGAPPPTRPEPRRSPVLLEFSQDSVFSWESVSSVTVTGCPSHLAPGAAADTLSEAHLPPPCGPQARLSDGAHGPFQAAHPAWQSLFACENTHPHTHPHRNSQRLVGRSMLNGHRSQIKQVPSGQRWDYVRIKKKN